MEPVAAAALVAVVLAVPGLPVGMLVERRAGGGLPVTLAAAMGASLAFVPLATFLLNLLPVRNDTRLFAAMSCAALFAAGAIAYALAGGPRDGPAGGPVDAGTPSGADTAGLDERGDA